ncbi:Jouberin, partial [Rhizoclosmatium sp. JEL0117]
MPRGRSRERDEENQSRKQEDVPDSDQDISIEQRRKEKKEKDIKKKKRKGKKDKKSKRSRSRSKDKKKKNRSDSAGSYDRKLDREGFAENGFGKGHNMFSHVGMAPEDFEGYVCNIKLIKTDPLIADAMVLHPVVRVHIIDASTGHYVRKNPEVPATTFNEGAVIDYILPTMTKPYSFQKHQSTAASWNEDILIICEYLSLMRESTIIFFEILDFGTMGNNNENNDGWRRVAWAFVKLVAGHGQSNTEKELRLQLFQYPGGGHQLVSAAHQLLTQSAIRAGAHASQDSANTETIPYVYECWLSGKRDIYPSTMFVNISGKPCPIPIHVTTRPRNAAEIERGKLTYEQ